MLLCHTSVINTETVRAGPRARQQVAAPRVHRNRIKRGASCSQKGRGGRHCCWRGGQEGPGMRVTLPDWLAQEAAEREKQKNQ